MDKYVLVQWPESQQLMEHERFNECLLIQDIEGHSEVGGSAYMCPEDLYDSLFNILHIYVTDFNRGKIYHIKWPKNGSNLDEWIDHTFNMDECSYIVLDNPINIEEYEIE